MAEHPRLMHEPQGIARSHFSFSLVTKFQLDARGKIRQFGYLRHSAQDKRVAPFLRFLAVPSVTSEKSVRFRDAKEVIDDVEVMKAEDRKQHFAEFDDPSTYPHTRHSELPCQIVAV